MTVHDAVKYISARSILAVRRDDEQAKAIARRALVEKVKSGELEVYGRDVVTNEWALIRPVKFDDFQLFVDSGANDTGGKLVLPQSGRRAVYDGLRVRRSKVEKIWPDGHLENWQSQ